MTKCRYTLYPSLSTSVIPSVTTPESHCVYTSISPRVASPNSQSIGLCMVRCKVFSMLITGWMQMNLY